MISVQNEDGITVVRANDRPFKLKQKEEDKLACLGEYGPMFRKLCESAAKINALLEDIQPASQIWIDAVQEQVEIVAAQTDKLRDLPVREPCTPEVGLKYMTFPPSFPAPGPRSLG